jgi:hypothetical protein
MYIYFPEARSLRVAVPRCLRRWIVSRQQKEEENISPLQKFRELPCGISPPLWRKIHVLSLVLATVGYTNALTCNVGRAHLLDVAATETGDGAGVLALDGAASKTGDGTSGLALDGAATEAGDGTSCLAERSHFDWF